MTKIIDATDKRWSGYVPWFFRHDTFTGTGDYDLFFERLCNRSFQLFYYNELGITNNSHFGSLIGSKSLNRYIYEYNSAYGDASLAYSIKNYFNPKNFNTKIQESLNNNPLHGKLNSLFIALKRGGWKPELNYVPTSMNKEFKEHEEIKAEYQKVREECYRNLIIERLGVLEVILINLPKTASWFNDFIKDSRAYLAEAGLMLDIDENNYYINLLEEPLLQKGVLENLLPRLKSKLPERADELVKAYHDLLNGNSLDEIFISAFKTLEEIGRSLTLENKFEFNQSYLDKYFPKLHKTTHITMTKLAAHRGDKGGHGRNAPDAIEMRYLLFSICNIALLILDYQE